MLAQPLQRPGDGRLALGGAAAAGYKPRAGGRVHPVRSGHCRSSPSHRADGPRCRVRRAAFRRAPAGTKGMSMVEAAGSSGTAWHRAMRRLLEIGHRPQQVVRALDRFARLLHGFERRLLQSFVIVPLAADQRCLGGNDAKMIRVGQSHQGQGQHEGQMPTVLTNQLGTCCQRLARSASSSEPTGSEGAPRREAERRGGEASPLGCAAMPAWRLSGTSTGKRPWDFCCSGISRGPPPIRKPLGRRGTVPFCFEDHAKFGQSSPVFGSGLYSSRCDQGRCQCHPPVQARRPASICRVAGPRRASNLAGWPLWAHGKSG